MIAGGSGDFSIEDCMKKLDDALLTGKGREVFRFIVESVERPMIEKALARTFGNQVKAAKLLGINRNTLRSKVKRFGIDVSKWKI